MFRKAIMGGVSRVDEHTLLYLHGDSFTDLAKPEREITNHNNVQFTYDGRFGKVFDFKGMNDYIEFPSDDEFTFENKDFTFEHWANLSSTQREWSSCHRFNTDNTNVEKCGILICFYSLNNIIASAVFDTGQINIGWKADEWFHMAFEMKGNSSRIYLNGKKVSEKTVNRPSKIFNGNNVCCIGSSAYLANRFENKGLVGKICRFRVSDIARYDADFTPSYKY